MPADSSTILLYDFAWVSDPTAWIGLLTLCVIQIVLGIDNLLFIAVLSAKLPPRQRARARYIGIGGALVIRLVLIMAAAYAVAAAEPLFMVFGIEISVRDVVMAAGGLFLLYKSVQELHAKLEGNEEAVSLSRAGGRSLTLVSVQIMVLDALFSVDAIISAVGMTQHVYIMMIAVCAAMAVMLMAAGLVTEFVSSHPTLVILCLGFLLLIGFSLLLEGLHFEVPKGYLYAAIGFAIMIEAFNQVARRNTLRLGATAAMKSRELAASLVLRLLGSRTDEVHTLKEAIVSGTGEGVFDSQEKEMVARVLQLSSLPVKAVMTARTDLETVCIDEPAPQLIAEVRKGEHTLLVACRTGQKDQPLGVIRRADILSAALQQPQAADGRTLADLSLLVMQPVFLPESVSILKTLDEMRRAKRYTGFVFDEFGNFEGLVTLHDVMEEVAGELPDPAEMPEIVRLKPGVYRIDGEAILSDVARITGFSVPPSEHYQTLAGFILDYLQRLPEQGERFELGSWTLEIVQTSATSIEVVRLTSHKR